MKSLSLENLLFTRGLTWLQEKGWLDWGKVRFSNSGAIALLISLSTLWTTGLAEMAVAAIADNSGGLLLSRGHDSPRWGADCFYGIWLLNFSEPLHSLYSLLSSGA
ncbi:MAG: hypothetical protein HC772_18450 [Leptolyngbyaceae cyanobacterium CRU_2_3]|nr:hypothetical protein [Leptolyngbyaceae cyanobacterium CRU_2_3]